MARRDAASGQGAGLAIPADRCQGSVIAPDHPPGRTVRVIDMDTLGHTAAFSDPGHAARRRRGVDIVR